MITASCRRSSCSLRLSLNPPRRLSRSPAREAEATEIISQQKGFDSSYGGCPSPIFPDGTIYSLPIPGDDHAAVHHGDLDHGNVNIGQVVEDFTRGRLDARDGVHLDPDVRQDAIRRHNGWRGIFGRTGAPEGHLEKQGVGTGDVFLFSASSGGWRRPGKVGGSSEANRNSTSGGVGSGLDRRAGCCRVDEIRGDGRFDWARHHGHFSRRGDPGNPLYVTTHQPDLGDSLTVPGAGVFPRFDEGLVLTEPGGPVSQWRLPRWVYPDGGRTPLTCHPDATRWQRDSDCAYLQSVGRGQEFVLDLEEYPAAGGWIAGMARDFGAN